MTKLKIKEGTDPVNDILAEIFGVENVYKKHFNTLKHHLRKWEKLVGSKLNMDKEEIIDELFSARTILLTELNNTPNKTTKDSVKR